MYKKNEGNDNFMHGSPILIAGAPRSGTKMLRELLKLHPDITGPVYEKERVWCHGNPARMNRSLSVEDLTSQTKTFVRSHFEREARKHPGKMIVDKNVCHCLRIAFIHQIFPKSPIIHIVRDGRDAVCSIWERWKNPLDLAYIIRNRAFSLRELPHFLKRQLEWKRQRLLRRKKVVNWWGPQFDDMKNLSENYSVIEICGIQWLRCVEAAVEGLELLENGTHILVKYENILRSPADEMAKICAFLGLDVDGPLRRKFEGFVRPSGLNRWRLDLTARQVRLLMRQIEKTMSKLKYGQ